MCGEDTIPVNNFVVGRTNLNDIIHNKNTIILKNQTLNLEHVIELQRIGYEFINVESKQLGEMCFVNNNI